MHKAVSLNMQAASYIQVFSSDHLNKTAKKCIPWASLERNGLTGTPHRRA